MVKLITLGIESLHAVKKIGSLFPSLLGSIQERNAKGLLFRERTIEKFPL